MFFSEASSLARRDSDRARGPRSWRTLCTRRFRLILDLGVLDRASKVQRRPQVLLGDLHFGDDAPGERAVLRDVGAGAGVELAGADGDVAQRDRAAVVAPLAVHLVELGAPGAEAA